MAAMELAGVPHYHLHDADMRTVSTGTCVILLLQYDINHYTTHVPIIGGMQTVDGCIARRYYPCDRRAAVDDAGAAQWAMMTCVVVTGRICGNFARRHVRQTF